MNIINQYNNFNFYHMKKLFTAVAMALSFCFSANALQDLKLVGNQLCTADGNPIQLRGWSTHGSWFKSCYDDEQDFAKQKEKGANVARIAMYINEGEGINESWVKSCIDFCANQGLYCIVDWHILKDDPNAGEGQSKANPMTRKDDAVSFFRNITSYVASKNYNHVLYEICNEPNTSAKGDVYPLGIGYDKKDGNKRKEGVWNWIKEYCTYVLPVIKQGDPDAIVLVGTPQWDQGLVFPMMDPIDENGLQVMYSFHYYAYDQERYLGFLSGAAAFLPVFVTEWSISSHDGGGGVDTNSADHMMDVCNGKNLGKQIISWVNWSWSDKGESSGTFTGGGYSNMSFSETGKYMCNRMAAGDQWDKSVSKAYQGEAQEFNGSEDFYLALEKFDEGGQGVAYYDFEDADWHPCYPNQCNAGVKAGKIDMRGDDNVDLGYCDENNKAESFVNLGYIAQGEWVQYTINVKYAGDFEFETYTTNAIDYNAMAIAVDGENALVDEEGNEINRVVELQTSGSGKIDDGYNEWGWTTPICPVAKDKKFRIRFKTPGEHKLALVFMASTSGLGSLKIIGQPGIGVGVEDVPQAVVKVWPNPSEDGVINVLVDTDSQVSIYNAQGVEVLSSEVKANVCANLNTSLKSGVYYVNVKSEKGLSVEKLIVK